MKTNTNITYKDFKETDIFKSAVIIEFINANGQSSFDNISDEALESMIVKDIVGPIRRTEWHLCVGH